MTRYIRINTLKQTLREDLRLAPSWKVLFLWIPKLLRRRLDFMSGVPIPVPFADFVINETAVPPDAKEKLSTPLREAARLGFAPPVFHLSHTLAGESVTTSANHYHAGGEMVARSIHVHLGNVQPAKQRLALNVMSQFQDGRRLVTTNQRPTFLGPPNIIVQRQVGGSLEELFRLHRKKLEELKLQTKPEQVVDESSLAVFCDRAETEALEFQLRRGLYEEMKPEDATAQSNRAAANRALAGDNQTDAAVLTEIEKLNSARGSWQAALTVGLISLVAFIALGGLKWNWTFVLILTGVVAFHELGHFVAMRALEYSDVRMFFVPLLGAAVTGRHYNVKGWQRTVVSLAGPVPGILVGWVIIALNSRIRSPMLDRVALVTLMVNGINLLPFVPLDGGWVMHAVVFSRHFILETAFLGLAGASLVGATLLGWGRLWMYLGILILIGLPASYRLTRLASRLRSIGLCAASPDAKNIPPETALAILREIKGLPQGLKLARHLANQVLTVFQKLNATPPSFGSSVLLLILYLAAGGAAFVGIAGVFATRLNPFSSPSTQAWQKPASPVYPTEVRTIRSRNGVDFNWSAPCTVATFTNQSQAQEAFSSVTNRLEPGDSLTLFGRSVFLSAGSNRLGWFGTTAAQAFEEHPGLGETATIRLSCRAKDETTAIALAEDCDTYLSGLRLRPWPPWVEVGELEPERKQAAESLIYTWGRLYAIQRTVNEDEAYRRLRYPHGFRLRRWTGEEMMAQIEKSGVMERAIYRRELDKLSQAEDARLDKQFVELYGQAWFAEEDQERAWSALEETRNWRLGSLPMSANTPAHPRAWQAAMIGSIERQKAELRFPFITFYRTDCGLPALVYYLYQHGCGDFFYEFQPPPPSKRDDEEAH